MSPSCWIVFQFYSKVKVLISLFTFFQFYSVVSRDSKVHNFAYFLSFFFFFFLLIIIRSGLLAEIWWSVCMSKFPRRLCVSFSRTGCWVVHIPFLGMVKFKFLAHFLVNHLAHPVVSSLVLLLCQFAASAYYVIDGFISVTCIAYICCFVASYLSTPWYDWVLWRCFVIIIIIIISSFYTSFFFTPALVGGPLLEFEWQSQISRTLLSILVDFNNAVIWVVSILPLISCSSCIFSKPLWGVPCTPTAIGLTVTFMFHSFF